MSIVSTQDILYNFLAGGIMAVILIYILNYFRKYNIAGITGFVYGAPFLLPYFALSVYLHAGKNTMAEFSKHTLGGILLTIPILLSLWFSKHTLKILGSSLFYLLVITICYFMLFQKGSYSLS